MRVGETVRGFTIVAEPTTSGGGRCVWSYAERDGQQYFIKQFLDPKWPTESSMGSPVSKKLRREECEAFERRHQDVNRRINGRAAGGGNLVTAVDFFRDGSTYYKVTDRVVAEPANDLCDLTDRQTAVVLRTLCHSMRLLHRAGIVHGDLKPANVLLQRSTTVDLITAKMIDFDDSYLSGDPPPPDEIVGDQNYGSPEWLRYVKEDPDVPPEQLTTAADIFALALLFHVYLTGKLPGYDPARFGSPAEAVWAGADLRFSARLHPRTTAMLRRMTSASIADRPAVDELITLLNDENAVRVAAVDVPEPRVGSRVRTNMGRALPEPPGWSPPAPPAGGASRLRKSFDH